MPDPRAAGLLANQQINTQRDRREAVFLFVVNNVRFWHKADIQSAPVNVRFRGESGHALDSSNVR